MLGEDAFYFGYVMLASDGIPAGGLFNWKLDTSDERVYTDSTASTQQIIHEFLESGHAGTTWPRRYHGFPHPCVLARV